ncbi:MAG: tRNA pseudouridine(55) synthase TruB [Eubacteriales bacterium]|nr:tRNA pseudouridine(55) synthase TruB [Eubacteriales bacterium]
MHYKYNGFINVYKEAGWTSMDVCAKLKGILGVRKIGHAGTLDPMAEGVLPVAVGRATKDIDFVGDGFKEYRAEMLLGVTTDTEDITGNVLGRYEGELPGETEVRDAVMSFVGEYDQLTPMYSARKVNGKKLYEYARAGKEVERKTKHISIDSISIEKVMLPKVTFTVRCSKGTYIRSLCRDIGEKLGCGACMSALLRTRVGDFEIGEALRIAEISELAGSGTGGIDSILSIRHATAVTIGKFDGAHVGHQALIRELKKTAEALKLRTLVIILKFGKPGVLTDAERKEKLYELGVDYCIELEFTPELMNMSAEDFLEKILIDRFCMKAIVGGKDISFGRGKAGNAEFLYANADKYGYTVDLIEKVKIEGESGRTSRTSEGDSAEVPADDAGRDISSTMLRSAIKNGDMQMASELLGSSYSISGVVVHGKGLAGSSRMNYPTMNIEVADELNVPPYGVYAVKAEIFESEGSKGAGTAAGGGGRGAGTGPGGCSAGSGGGDSVLTVSGIANLGERPTVHGSVEGGTRLRLEVHAFGDIGDCYGKLMKVQFCSFIRPERKFDSIDELISQIFEKDIPACESYFSRHGES